MQNKWFTYSFLGLLVLALITLALLQYQWLGSVSEAEKKRLEDGLDASIENFVSDFNDVFSETGDLFRVQVTGVNPDYEALLTSSFQRWFSATNYQELIDSVYFLKSAESGEPTVYLLSTDPPKLTEMTPDSEVKFWIESNYEDLERKSMPLRVHPNFGNPTFMAIPIQFLDMINVRKESPKQNIEIRLSVDQLDDVILLKLDDAFIKQKLIPDIARTYFSDSYDDQYVISVAQKSEETKVYFTNAASISNLPDPEFSTSLDRINFKSLVMFSDNENELRNFKLPGIADSVEISISEIDTFSILEHESILSNRLVTSNFFSDDVSSFSYRTNDTGAVSSGWTSTTMADTLVNSTVFGLMRSSPWELWVSFKDGSLEAFVDGARNKNLMISFGILSILGISVVFIVILAQRSRDLAEQQMLFVAGVSHELRTPITVIRSAAENLSEGVVQTESRKKEYATLMLNEGRRLSDMVDQIMEFSGIQAGKRVYNFTEIEIEGLINEVLREIKPVLEHAGIQLEYANSLNRVTMNADYDALYLSLSNLLNNAIKFSGSSKRIKLKLDELKPKGDYLAIMVQDFGVGIPTEEQKKVFRPFFRGKQSVDNQAKGNGIGLSLVQKVAQAHGGEIRLKSEVGTGSTFTLLIPFSHE